ncbi:MAG TPA: hypothetical protein VKV57_02370 [bacterium]|nr:hypothetical protein [bacterium]
MPRVVVHVGHVLDILGRLPAASVHSVVTSPPYYGLRDYGLPPQDPTRCRIGTARPGPVT